ncbi:hypothetical protein E4U57_000723 [Claviceps arundinis]|uniref:DUF4238 domain-containing protein n=1 Tax=Claviceps arundinis TaxID=1623583 RepID=A0ABQ7PC55_9HYPO|nr:hypothetical protein E4U57_000723 [Claviceps arundinis]
MERHTAVPKQYFVPRFLLENFSHPFRPQGKGEAARLTCQTAQTQNASSRSNGKKLRRGESVVNHIDMSTEVAFATEKPVGSIFGRFNMYQKAGISNKEQTRIEHKFNRFESDASAIFRRMLTALTANSRGLWLTREERNQVRKFMFVMKYRGPTSFGRYCHATMETYSAEDKEQLAMYMREKSFSRPIDVWMDNLEKLIDVKIDAEMDWIQQLPTRMYPADAYWAITHIQCSYMTLCTPSARDAEFIVTDNCYSIAEGPHEVPMDAKSGKRAVQKWTSLHEFGPISPRLLIVLRSTLFPSPQEDGADADVKETRKLSQSCQEAMFGPLSETLLADLPVSKASNNYSEVVDGVLRAIPGAAGAPSRGHSFFFDFFQLENAHVDRINGVFLNNASSCNSLVFHTEAAFRRSLEWYMADCEYFPKYVAGTTPAAAFSTAPSDRLQHRACLRKLGGLLTQLGSEKRFFQEDVLPTIFTQADERESLLEALQRDLPSLLRHIPDADDASPFMQVYRILGGSKETLQEDLIQSARMLKLRIKIDVWSRGVDENLRHSNREYLIEQYLMLPRRRFWLYLKRCRLSEDMEHHKEGQHPVNLHTSVLDAPEDIIARAWRVAKPGSLNHLMYWAVGNSLLKSRPPGFDPWARIGSLGHRGIQHLAMVQAFAFCRILKIEQFCSVIAPGARLAARWQDFGSLLAVFTTDQMTEMAIRLAVEPVFKSLLSGDLEEGLLNALAEVFFKLLCPLVPEMRA